MAWLERSPSLDNLKIFNRRDNLQSLSELKVYVKFYSSEFYIRSLSEFTWVKTCCINSLLFWFWWSDTFAFQPLDFSGNIIWGIILYFRYSPEKIKKITFCFLSFSKPDKVFSICRITDASTGYILFSITWTSFNKFTSIE